MSPKYTLTYRILGNVIRVNGQVGIFTYANINGRHRGINMER